MTTMNFPEYNEAVLRELELLGFDKLVHVLCEIGIPHNMLAKAMSYMARACHLEEKEPSDCANEITLMVLTQFRDALVDVLNNNFMQDPRNFPKE